MTLPHRPDDLNTFNDAIDIARVRAGNVRAIGDGLWTVWIRLTQLLRDRTIESRWGLFTQVPLSAANFTTSTGGVTWVLASTDVLTYQWTLHRRRLLLTFDLVNTSIVGGAAGSLLLALPPGMRVAKSVVVLTRVIDNGAAAAVGLAVAVAGTTVLELYSTIVGGGWAASANATLVQGQIDIEIDTYGPGDHPG